MNTLEFAGQSVQVSEPGAQTGGVLALRHHTDAVHGGRHDILDGYEVCRSTAFYSTICAWYFTVIEIMTKMAREEPPVKV